MRKEHRYNGELFELFPDYEMVEQIESDVRDNAVKESKHLQRLARIGNLNLIEDLATENGYLPIEIKATKGFIPNKLIAFSKASRARLYDKIVHFYEYDYVIDAIWRHPKKYLGMLKRALAVIGPDFSISPGFPDAVNEWHLYKIKVISHYLQQSGVNLIPNLPVCSPKMRDELFSNLERGGIYAISNVQAYNNYFSRHQWYGFVREAVRILNPESLIVYGNRMEVSGVRVFYFDNENLINLRNGKKK